jgi:uncharacterized membrane protein
VKVSRCANYHAHALAKWVTAHLVFGSISIGSPILSSIRINNGKYPPLFFLINYIFFFKKKKKKKKLHTLAPKHICEIK